MSNERGNFPPSPRIVPRALHPQFMSHALFPEPAESCPTYLYHFGAKYRMIQSSQARNRKAYTVILRHNCSQCSPDE